MLALRSDWESALHAFEQQLSTVLAQALSGAQVRDAALA
jgi:hypothetical protein